MEVIIKAINLTKKFGSLVAVNHINFEVYKGEIFGFLGPNGAGKTTTVNMLTTILKPTEGTATINGYDIVKDAVKVRQTIGVVHQEFTADEDLTGYENMMLAAALYGIPKNVAKQRVEELLKMVELTNAKDRKVETYSGGMRRRLEVAMGLINRPAVLFLDEPTLGLDVQTRTAIWSYILKLKEEYNMTIFMTTHYLEEADAYCDRIAIIDKGRILKIGAPSELKESLGGGVIAIQIASNVDEAVKVISQLDGVLDIKSDKEKIRIKAKNINNLTPELLRSLFEKGIKVTKLEMSEPTLDEVYLELTGRSLRDEQASWEEIFSMRRTIRRARA
ncbi:MAG: ATP-binding cassette domain-containing protein [Thermoproteota archaeon]|jgi:ABC-2 type transport system ATP-binding protein|nr:ATP-binding cassette domain-containing protein [Thermoproteota archaeon]